LSIEEEPGHFAQNGDTSEHGKVIIAPDSLYDYSEVTKTQEVFEDTHEQEGLTNKGIDNQNLTARYAVSYRSIDSASSSTNSYDERAISSGEEFMPSLPMKGGKGKSFFPVRNGGGLTRKINSFYSIPPPNFMFRPGISSEKLV